MSDAINPKFLEARDMLSDAFNKLEQAVLEKIKAAREIPSGASDDVEQTIANLNIEVNRLQKDLAELGVENETILQKNNEMIIQIAKIRESKLVMNSIKYDLERIKQIVESSVSNQPE